MTKQLPDHCLSCPYLLDKMGSCQYPGTNYIDVFISTLPYLSILVILPIMFIARKRVSFITSWLILVTSYIFADRVLKNIIKDPRPEGACKLTFGFPSSHMVVTGAIAYLLISRSKTLALVISLLQGYSRYILRYHTVQQILAGWVFGLMYAFVAQKVLMILYRKFGYKIIRKIRFLIDDITKEKKEEQLKEQ